MIKAALIVFATSFIAWFIERHENQVVYPFDRKGMTPAEAGEPRLRDAGLQTPDGERLVVWSARAKPGRPTLLYFPGNAGTLARRIGRFRAFLDRGYGLTALAYRGSSGSSGKPDEIRLTEDARLLASLQGDAPLVLYGESLGSAVAVKLAAEGIGDALILEAPFTSIPDLVQVQYPEEDLADLFTQIWDTRSVMAEVTQPLLILHGTQDRLVPIAQGRELLAIAGSSEKRLVALDGAGHTEIWSQSAQTALYAFLDAL